MTSSAQAKLGVSASTSKKYKRDIHHPYFVEIVFLGCVGHLSQPLSRGFSPGGCLAFCPQVARPLRRAEAPLKNQKTPSHPPPEPAYRSDKPACHPPHSAGPTRSHGAVAARSG